MPPPLYVFRAAGSPVTYYLAGDRRIHVKSEPELRQLGFTIADVRILDPGNDLFRLPIINP